MNTLYNLFNNIVFQTVISGVLVFTIGQIVQNYIFEPIINYKNIVAQADNKLKFYANITSNPGSDEIPRTIYLSCHKEIRSLSCDIEAAYKILPFQCLRWRQKNKVSNAAKSLIFISNNLFRPSNESPIYNSDKESETRKDLGIEIL